MTAPTKRGRPPLPPDERRRACRVTVGLGADERAEIDRWAASRGLTVAEALRRCALASARRLRVVVDVPEQA